MRGLLPGALLLAVETANAQDDLNGRILDLIFATRDLRFAVVALGGKTQNLQVRETATEVRIELAADVLFDFDKATIKPAAATALHNAAEIITSKGQRRSLSINGYTDAKGSDAYNRKLSERRAEAVRQWLARNERLGAIPMVTRGFGARNPVAPNTNPDGSDNPVGRQRNRRVEIVLAK